MARRSGGVSAVDRVVAVLEAFTPDEPVLTPGQLVRRSGLSAPTVYRLVGELVERGLLEREPRGGGVRVGLRLWELASRAPRGLGLCQTAMPHLLELHARVGHHTHLAVLEGCAAVFLERLSAPVSVPNLTRIGGRIPAHASATGLVLLAHASPQQQELALAAPMRRYTPSTPCSAPEVRVELASVRRYGHIICDGYIDLSSAAVSAPVWGVDGVVAAITAVVPAGRIRPSGVVKAVRSAAELTSRDLQALPATTVPQISH